MMQRLLTTIAALGLFGLGAVAAAADELSPYGTAQVDMREYPTTNAVFDVNYEDPEKLNILYAFVKNT
jgi:hypothetical protein